METVKQVEEFHEKFGLLVNKVPALYTMTSEEIEVLKECLEWLENLECYAKQQAAYHNSAVLLRFRLIASEFKELFDAIASENLVHALHEGEDLQYVVDGFFVETGLQNVKAEGFIRVHEANMSKLAEDGTVIRDSSGKVQKGPNFKPATMEGLV